MGNPLLDSLLREYPKAEKWVDMRTHPSALVLYAEGNRAREVYFPLTGVLGLVIRAADGQARGMIPIGNEGFAGIGAFLEAESNVHSIVQQLGGQVACVPASSFRAAVDANQKLRKLTRRYTVYLLRMFQQALACEQSHTLRQRTSLWLLRVRDWMQEDEFPLTQDALASMLGVRRQSISEAAGELQNEGCIKYHRAQMRIADVGRLARAACDCYPALSLTYDRLLPRSRA